MKAENIIRYIIVASFLAILAWLIKGRFDRLHKEETVISQKYSKTAVALPSITICAKWLSKRVPKTKQYTKNGFSLQDMDNWTFDDFMEKSYDVKNVIERAIFNDQSNDRKKL